MQAKSDFDDELIESIQAFSKTLEAQSGLKLGPDKEQSSNSTDNDLARHRKSKAQRGQRLMMWASAAVVITFAVLTVTILRPFGGLDSADEPETSLDIDLNGGRYEIFASDGLPIGSYAEFKQDPKSSISPFVAEHNDYYIEAAIREIETKGLLAQSERPLSELLDDAGLRIYTSYDNSMQVDAVESVYELMPVEVRNGSSAGLLTLDSNTGAVKALVGSPTREETYDDGEDSGSFKTIEVMTQGKLQPANTFIPFTLATLFEAGYYPGDRVSGLSPCTFVTDAGQEYRVMGPGVSSPPFDVTLKEAANGSYNCSQIRLGIAVGVDNILEVASKLGAVGSEEQDLATQSTPLGTNSVTPIDMTAAYAVFANDGRNVNPWFVTKIETYTGEVLFERPVSESNQVIQKQTARLVTEVLESSVNEGTGTNAALDNRSVAGQTGTAQSNIGAWYIGYTNHYTTSVWIGNNESGTPEPIEIEGYPAITGGSLPAEIFAKYMNEIHKNLEPIEFAAPVPYDNPEGRTITAENETTE